MELPFLAKLKLLLLLACNSAINQERFQIKLAT